MEMKSFGTEKDRRQPAFVDFTLYQLTLVKISWYIDPTKRAKVVSKFKGLFWFEPRLYQQSGDFEGSSSGHSASLHAAGIDKLSLCVKRI